MCFPICWGPYKVGNYLILPFDLFWSCWFKPCTPINFTQFDPEITGNRMIYAEFEDLMNLIIKECNNFYDIQIFKICYFPFIFIQFFLFLSLSNQFQFGGLFIFAPMLIFTTLIFLYYVLGIRMSAYELKIRIILKHENTSKYAQRGLYWDVGRFCRYIKLNLDYFGLFPLLNNQMGYVTQFENNVVDKGLDHIECDRANVIKNKSKIIFSIVSLMAVVWIVVLIIMQKPFI